MPCRPSPTAQNNGKMSEIKPVAPIYTYMAVSLSNVIATTCQYEALKYVSFPVQTLVRECRRTGVTEIH